MANLPNELGQSIKAANAMLGNNRLGELILPARKKIWTALGKRNAIGRARRASLAIQSAERVAPIWKAVFVNTNEPEQVLHAAQSYLGGKIDESTLRKLIAHLWTALDDLIYDGQFLIEINAGYASASAASTAVSDEKFDEDNPSDLTLDEEIDAFEWDAGYYASIAYSGGTPGDDTSDSVMRREFWEWYINIAVPTAWSSA